MGLTTGSREQPSGPRGRPSGSRGRPSGSRGRPSGSRGRPSGSRGQQTPRTGSEKTRGLEGGPVTRVSQLRGAGRANARITRGRRFVTRDASQVDLLRRRRLHVARVDRVGARGHVLAGVALAGDIEVAAAVLREELEELLQRRVQVGADRALVGRHACEGVSEREASAERVVEEENSVVLVPAVVDAAILPRDRTRHDRHVGADVERPDLRKHAEERADARAALQPQQDWRVLLRECLREDEVGVRVCRRVDCEEAGVQRRTRPAGKPHLR
mmetsp:Transcript_36879/g.97643  ORF Transcript_36879/g.97643 Transcript_36879/m.97643 type:complete len:272 (+) Transcript_36879:1379-2194(+)